MDPNERRKPDETTLSQVWDALLRGETIDVDALDPDTLATLRQLHAIDDAPAPGDDLIEQLWSQIEAPARSGAAAAPLRVDPGQVTATNGHRAVNETGLTAVAVAAPIETKPVSGSARRLAAPRRLAGTVARDLAIGALAGFLVGFFVVGGASRLFMRVAAMLSDRSAYGTLTGNDNVVGTISLGGTLSLMMMCALFGLIGGVGFMAVRSWLPRAPWQQAVASGLLFFALTASDALEQGDNPDYKRFGIFGLNVCLFTLLPLLFGLGVAPLVSWLDRKIPANLPRFSRSLTVVLASGIMLFLALFGLMGVISIALDVGSATLLLLLPLIRLAQAWWPSRSSPDRLPALQRRTTILGYSMLAASCAIGLVLTLQALGRLM